MGIMGIILCTCAGPTCSECSHEEEVRINHTYFGDFAFDKGLVHQAEPKQTCSRRTESLPPPSLPCDSHNLPSPAHFIIDT